MPQLSSTCAISSVSGSAEISRSLRFGRDGDAGEIVRGEDGGVGGFGDGDVDVLTGALRNGFGDLMRRAVEALQAVDAEDDGVGRGLFEPGRESLRRFAADRPRAVNAGEHYPMALALKLAACEPHGLARSCFEFHFAQER